MRGHYRHKALRYPRHYLMREDTNDPRVSSRMTATEVLLRRDRWIVGAGLAVICVLSWGYIISGASTGMSTMAMTTWEFPPPLRIPTTESSWGASYWIVMLIMWWVMMIAMMVPSAAPMILLYARARRQTRKSRLQDSTIVPTGAFTSGYLVCWLAFSVIATSLQWTLEQAGLVHSLLMWSTSNTLSGIFLMAAGIYQLTPIKNVCLKHCRSPLHFLMHHWRETSFGVFRMGLEHGSFCVGCCWFLMVLLFVGGTMNLFWIAGLAVFVLIEKVSRFGMWIGRAAGVLMLGAGLYLVMLL